jgi:hypothetical protein
LKNGISDLQLDDPYDNSGPDILGLDKDDIIAQEELAAFDQLGPAHTQSH